MAWKPKTIAGKLLKGAVIAGGSVLGVATGVNLIGKVGGVALKSGTAALAKTGGVLSNVRTKVDRVAESAKNLVTGITKEQREQVLKVKQDLKTEAEKLKLVDKYVAQGVPIETARAKAGLMEMELTEYAGEPVKSAGFGDIFQNKGVLMAVAAAAAAYFLLKAKK